MFYEFLKKGKKITISDKNGVYTSATFFYKDNAIWVDSETLVRQDKHKTMTACPTLFDDHINNMLAEGFVITIE